MEREGERRARKGREGKGERVVEWENKNEGKGMERVVKERV